MAAHVPEHLDCRAECLALPGYYLQRDSARNTRRISDFPLVAALAPNSPEYFYFQSLVWLAPDRHRLGIQWSLDLLPQP